MIQSLRIALNFGQGLTRQSFASVAGQHDSMSGWQVLSQSKRDAAPAQTAKSMTSATQPKRLINNVTDLRHLLIFNKINHRRKSR